MIVEENHYGGNWFDRLNNWLAVDTDTVRTAAVARDAEGWYVPDRQSLFYNGYVMARFNWPFGVFVHLRWRKDARLQFGLGWKLNGRFAILGRYQTDQNAAEGVHGPNHGQATGWARGTA